MAQAWDFLTAEQLWWRRGPMLVADEGGSNSTVATLANDLSDEALLDTTAAAARFGYPRDTIAGWCRAGDGVKVGGRWMASVPRLQRRLNGGGSA